MSGTVWNVQRFCLQDGPGIRTTVFLKGCPLHCVWCHNPESQRAEPQLLYDPEKCVHCLKCTRMCAESCHRSEQGKHVFDRTRCLACGACCSPLCHALELCGRQMSADEVLAEVLRDRPFYEQSGGGLTLSGGEPLYQAAFCTELLRKAKEQGLHTCLETCGFAPRQVLEETAAFVDLYLFDYKETDPERHKQFTGVDNRPILENLAWLDGQGKPILLRCPVIPGYNDRADHFLGIAETANRLQNVIGIAVEPYHDLGARKYGTLGREYLPASVKPPTKETVEGWMDAIRCATSVPVSKA